jgi:hypothetical protein
MNHRLCPTPPTVRVVRSPFTQYLTADHSPSGAATTVRALRVVKRFSPAVHRQKVTRPSQNRHEPAAQYTS